MKIMSWFALQSVSVGRGWAAISGSAARNVVWTSGNAREGGLMHPSGGHVNHGAEEKRESNTIQIIQDRTTEKRTQI